MIEWVSFAFVGVFSGITAGLLGLGGGIIMVPFYSISACALPIAISGVLGFIIFSEQQPITEE